MNNYRKILLALGGTYFGSWINLIAIVSIVYSLTGSKMALGITFIAKFLPKVIFSFASAAILDRFKIKKVMVLSELISALSVLGLIISFNIMGSVEGVYSFYFLLGGSVSVFEAGRIAIIPQINTISIDSKKFVSNITIVRYATMLVSTGLGGIMLEAIGPVPLLIIDMISFIFSACVISTLKIKGDEKKDSHLTNNIILEIKKGMQIIKNDKVIHNVVLSFGLNQAIYGVAQTAFSLIVLDKLQSSESSLGLSYTCGGVACIIAGYIFNKIIKYNNVKLVINYIIVLNALFLMFMFNVPYIYLFFAVVFAHDLFATMYEIYLDGSLVELSNKEEIGKISALYMTFGRLCHLLALILYTFFLSYCSYELLGLILAIGLLCELFIENSTKKAIMHSK